jgi:RimJ/RimL family protein N-acetyltransferase
MMKRYRMAPAINNASCLRFRPFSRSDALAMMSWRYPAPYSAYDLDSQDPTVLAELLRPENRYHAILRGNEMIGFFCLGADARVPGWNYDDSALDVGMGLRPDRTGQGEGWGCFSSVMDFVEELDPGRALRATVVAWNRRAIRLCEKAGFHATASFRRAEQNGQDYIVLLRQR